MKAAWKSIKVVSGEQFVMTFGTKLTLTSCAANWDIPTLSLTQEMQALDKVPGLSG
jgi:hypothetical protein